MLLVLAVTLTFFAQASMYPHPEIETEITVNEEGTIENNSDRNITAENVADALDRSRAYLNRVIKSVDGSCLSEKIISSRIKRIQNLCSVENLSLAEISQKLDFYSPELLCKFFKYHTGMSVSDYRNRYR